MRFLDGGLTLVRSGMLDAARPPRRIVDECAPHERGAAGIRAPLPHARSARRAAVPDGARARARRRARAADPRRRARARRAQRAVRPRRCRSTSTARSRRSAPISGFAYELGNAIFLISRLPGLIAHAHEERSRQSPMRQIDPKDHDYDGARAAAVARRKEIGVTIEDLTAATQMLVRVPSVNPSIAPREAHGESQVAAVARDWLLTHGVRAWLEDVAPGRSNLVAEVGAGAGPLLVFCAHLDTVGTDNMSIPPFDPTVSDGRLYGRGSYDMKGSAAAILVALKTLQRSSFKGRVMAALVADEEYASIGADDFVKRRCADACVVTEPSHGQLILAHKGFVWLRITTNGRAAHGSRVRPRRYRRSARWGESLPPSNDSTATRYGGGRIPLVGPALDALRAHRREEPASPHMRLVVHCRSQRRTLPDESPAAVAEEIRGGRLFTLASRAEVDVIFGRPGLTCDPVESDCHRSA